MLGHCTTKDLDPAADLTFVKAGDTFDGIAHGADRCRVQAFVERSNAITRLPSSHPLPLEYLRITQHGGDRCFQLELSGAPDHTEGLVEATVRVRERPTLHVDEREVA